MTARRSRRFAEAEAHRESPGPDGERSGNVVWRRDRRPMIVPGFDSSSFDARREVTRGFSARRRTRPVHGFVQTPGAPPSRHPRKHGRAASETTKPRTRTCESVAVRARVLVWRGPTLALGRLLPPLPSAAQRAFRRGLRRKARRPEMFDTVVFALDGSESSDRALACATALAKQHSSGVHVVHVVELSVGRGGGRAPLNEKDIPAKVEGQVRLSRPRGQGRARNGTVPAGGPAHAIAEVAAGRRRISSSPARVGIRPSSACCSGASRSACCTSLTARFSSFRSRA